MHAGDWITLLGVFATGVFNFLVWRATLANAKAAEASKDVAKATYDLTEKMMNIQHEKEQKEFETVRRSYRYRVLYDVNEVYDLLVNLSTPTKTGFVGDDVDRIRRYTKKPVLSPEEWAKYFSENELDLMNDIWKDLNRYMKLWIPEPDKWRFPQDYNDRVNWAASIIQRIYNLKEMLRT